MNSVSPVGVSRGTTVEMKVEGLNLAGASAVFFSEPGVKGKVLRIKELPDLSDVRLGSNGGLSTVDVGPLPPRNEVTLELEIAPDADIGPVSFRLQTPLGTSPVGKFLIEPFYGESTDREPDNTPEDAVETYLPAILTGTISRPGDVDFFKIVVKAGDQLVFRNGAMLIGSSLQPVVAILTEDQTVVHEFGNNAEMEALQFAYRFEKAGTYYVRVSDYDGSGRPSNFYRIIVGKYPLVEWAYPLGIERGKSREFQLTGYNLGLGKMKVSGDPGPDSEDSVLLRAVGPRGRSFNRLKLGIGGEPEIDASGTNLAVAEAQAVSLPVTVNGRIAAPEHGKPVENYYRFHARKNEKVIVDVDAQRLGSKLDSFIEVLDAAGKRIERATVRPVLQTFTTLSERDSSSEAIRVVSPTGFEVGDSVMVGQEIIRVRAMPRGPDDDVQFEGFAGQRLAYFDTTAEAHAIDQPVYKVQIYPPGAHLAPNGLPIVKLYYQNDDGGPGYGKDSAVHFTAPSDGDYLVRIHDVRGLGGPEFAYRLTIREPEPDFRLSVSPSNPNVPTGGSIPIEVQAMRQDEFEGPIEVSIEDLPPGLHAAKATIAAKQVSTTMLLSADAGAKLDLAAPLKVVGRATAGSRTLSHIANPEDKLKLVALMPKPDVLMTSETKEITLEPGGTAEVTVDVTRQNDFRGRVPVLVLNLPPRVRVLDVGLNGVLVTETAKRRSFKIEALPTAEPIEQWIYVAGEVETRSALQNAYAAQPILLKVKPAPTRISSR